MEKAILNDFFKVTLQYSAVVEEKKRSQKM